VFNNKHTYFI